MALIMGVSGAGKTTVGEALAFRLGWRFLDADSLHPPANVAKMASGIPLEDADRWPWLDRVEQALRASLDSGEPLVIACSALKAAYRARLLADDPRVLQVSLGGDPALIAARLAKRSGHFMPPSLLASQLSTEEPPVGALRVDVALPVEAQVARIASALGVAPGS